MCRHYIGTRAISLWLAFIIVVNGLGLVFDLTSEDGLWDDVGASTYYVGGSGGGNYSSIQDAIDDASDGDTVFVYNGIYNENIIN